MLPHDTMPLCACGCGEPVTSLTARVLRGHHWKMRGPDDWFWPNVHKSDGCWEWTGLLAPNGYGRISLARRSPSAHRKAWEIASGEVLTHAVKILHTCDNPRCVRNDEQGIYEVDGISLPRWGHLFRGTPKANTRDMIAKGRAKHGPPPHFYGEEHPGAQVTWPQVREIRRLFLDGAQIMDLVRQFNVSTTIVCAVVYHRTWHDPDYTPPRSRVPRATLTPDDVRAIRTAYAAGTTTRQELSARYGVSIPTIDSVTSRRRWAHNV